MGSLTPLDRILVLILVPLWVVCFALAVTTQFEGGGTPFIGFSVAGVESYPVLNGEFGTEYPSNPLEEAGLRVNDLLVRVGRADLRGVGARKFRTLVREEAGRDLDVSVVYERDGERRETSLGLVSISVFRPSLALSFSFGVSALFLLLRARPTRSVRAYFLAAFCLAIVTCLFDPFSAWGWILILTNGVLFPVLLRFAQVFPDDTMPKGRWQGIWPWFFALPGLFAGLILAGQYRLGTAGSLATNMLGLVAVLAVSTHKYHRLDAVSRRQMKWVLFGLYSAMLPAVVAFTITLLEPRLLPLAYLSFWAVPLFPTAFVVSIVRFNLFDVDRLLSATASYNVLLAALATGVLIVVPRAAEAISDLLGITPGMGQIALSLLLAGVVVPAHRRLRPQIDRVFFKDRYLLDHGIAELLPTLSQCPDARALTESVGEGLQRLLRPEACVVYARVEDSYVPVFVEGRAVPPSFGPASPLIGTLGERRKPLSLGEAGQRPDEAPLGPFDRAALETLGAEVVVPVCRNDALAAFLCLGPKRSGDVYTSTDLSHLTSIAETVSHQLQRFDQDELLREGREMQESLRRYVPGAIAEQLSSGAELLSTEREISILFVDIRGYTSFSESRRAEEIFSTVNRYTETVSEIVRKYGGAVVEFNGDGMMAVFGAPRDLAHKERAAVEAGCEVVEAVSAIPIESANQGREAERSQQEGLAVGVGVATGVAFVGNIQAVDRMIWTAIGNTTNLAARLQSLTRDLDAALVIDPATWKGAQPAAAGFERRPDVPIRGRRETQDVYLLPIP